MLRQADLPLCAMGGGALVCEPMEGTSSSFLWLLWKLNHLARALYACTGRSGDPLLIISPSIQSVLSIVHFTVCQRTYKPLLASDTYQPVR